MKLQDFQKRFTARINWGWSGDYAVYLLEKANNPTECAKIYKRVKLVAYRNRICEGDALHHLITHGKI